MEIKFFQVRDRSTRIPVMAVRVTAADCERPEHGELRHAGFRESDYVFVTKLTGPETQYDPYEWPANPRTMHQAHLYIEKRWGELPGRGDVVDVEFILGETAVEKERE